MNKNNLALPLMFSMKDGSRTYSRKDLNPNQVASITKFSVCLEVKVKNYENTLGAMGNKFVKI